MALCNFVGFTLTRNKLLAEHLRFTHEVKDFTKHNPTGRNQMGQCLSYVTVNAWKTSHIDLAIKSNITRDSHTLMTLHSDIFMQWPHTIVQFCPYVSIAHSSIKK